MPTSFKSDTAVPHLKWGHLSQGAPNRLSLSEAWPPVTLLRLLLPSSQPLPSPLPEVQGSSTADSWPPTPSRGRVPCPHTFPVAMTQLSPEDSASAESPSPHLARSPPSLLWVSGDLHVAKASGRCLVLILLELLADLSATVCTLSLPTGSA